MANLKNWLGQALSDSNHDKDRSNINAVTISQALFPVAEDDFDYDVESFAGLNIPILIVATKQDLAPDNAEAKNELVDLLKCELITVNCRNSKSLAPGTTNAVKLSRFFDRVCDKKFHTQQFNHYNTQPSEKGNLMQRQQSYSLNKFIRYSWEHKLVMKCCQPLRLYKQVSIVSSCLCFDLNNCDRYYYYDNHKNKIKSKGSFNIFFMGFRY